MRRMVDPHSNLAICWSEVRVSKLYRSLRADPALIHNCKQDLQGHLWRQVHIRLRDMPPATYKSQPPSGGGHYMHGVGMARVEDGAIFCTAKSPCCGYPSDFDAATL